MDVSSNVGTLWQCLIETLRPLVKVCNRKKSFLISQPKHMLWVLNRTVSMRRFF